MIPETIHKQPPADRVSPTLLDYERARAEFSWDRAARELSGLPHGGINIAHEAVDRHAQGSRATHLALRWIGKDGSRRDFTYSDLRDLTNRFANALQGLGIGAGGRVFVLAGRIPELYVAVLGALKNRSVACALFSAFGPEPIHTRLALGEAGILITTESLYEKKVAQLRERLPRLEHVLIVGDRGRRTAIPGTLDFWQLVESANPVYEIGATAAEDYALLHFTSGTTGMPKGAIHVHGAVIAHHITGRLALDLHPDDVFWCTADPGW
ncbi:MAG: AMP-binding protein, partial [Betaproteobacteria bacterium]|nr:AMP-binding protein [Betaproteobacteria bacterium]